MRAIIQKIMQYLKSVQAEMVKVSWPTRSELTGATVLVVLFSITFAVVVKIFDLGLSKLLGYILNM